MLSCLEISLPKLGREGRKGRQLSSAERGRSGAEKLWRIKKTFEPDHQNGVGFAKTRRERKGRSTREGRRGERTPVSFASTKQVRPEGRRGKGVRAATIKY